jgi:hypothetical protein
VLERRVRRPSAERRRKLEVSCRHVVLGLLMGMVIGGCGLASVPGDDSTHLGSLEPQLALPNQFLVYDPVTENLQQTDARWSMVAAGAPSANTCGDEAMWVWRHDARPPDTDGDPTIRLYICATNSAGSAMDSVSTTSIEDTVVPQLDDIYQATLVPLDDVGLSVRPATLACVWGTPAECRAWAFAAAYDRFVVNASFVFAAKGGTLDQEEFVAFITDLDAWIGRQLLE